MDPLELLASLEGLREKIPAFLRQDFEDLIAGIRNTYEMSVKYVTPPEPVHDGRRNLAAHHNTLDGLCTQLESSLEAFQLVYVGQASDAYHTRAAASLQDLKTMREHLAHAAVLHTTMATNFDTATEAKLALVALLAGLGITLGVLIASAGSTAPVTVPAAAFEVAGGAASIGLMTEAEAAAAAAIMGLIWSGMPDALLAGLEGIVATEVLGHIALHPTVISVPSNAQYPEPRDLTTDEADEVQNIVKEITARGFNVKEEWIEYLMRILGARMTAKEAGGVIRCMFNKGYIPKIETSKESTAPKVQISLKKAWNSLDHLTQQDLEGAWKDVHPDKVNYTGRLPSNAQHLDEVTNAGQSLQNLKDVLLDVITNPNTPENMRQVYQNLYDAVERTINGINNNIYSSEPPLTWPDKGLNPFGDDIISKSGCL